jgi:hypothetical protein
MISYVVSVRGPNPADLVRRIAEAHAAALNSGQTRRKTNAAQK